MMSFVPPNGARLSCAAKFQWSQMEFFTTRAGGASSSRWLGSVPAPIVIVAPPAQGFVVLVVVLFRGSGVHAYGFSQGKFCRPVRTELHHEILCEIMVVEVRVSD